MRGVLSVAIVIGATTLVSCDPDDIGHGVIDPFSIMYPATASTGEGFEVRVRTEGGCLSVEATDVSYIDDATALVEPIDHHRLPCNIKKLCVVEHSAEVRFATPGDKVIVFRGRQSEYDPSVLIDYATRMRVE